MRKLRTAVLAGAGAMLFAGAAVAATVRSHEMTVDLPDGAVAHIRYQGNVAPRVVVSPVVAEQVAFADPFLAFDPAPFAALDRVSAMMDRQADAMMQRVAQMHRQMPSDATAPHFAAMGKAPAGTMQYSFVSMTSDGNGQCTQSVEWRSDGSAAQPKMIRTSSGDCGSASAADKAAPVKTATAAAATSTSASVTKTNRI